MEKRFREYLKHFEKMDYDVLSDEEIQDEKTNLQLKTAVLHQEMVRLLVMIMGLLVCGCIFLSMGLSTGNIIGYICSAVMILLMLYFIMQYRAIGAVMKKLDAFVDKLTLL
jgi:hypothetical protein